MKYLKVALISAVVSSALLTAPSAQAKDFFDKTANIIKKTDKVYKAFDNSRLTKNIKKATKKVLVPAVTGGSEKFLLNKLGKKSDTVKMDTKMMSKKSS